MVDGVAQESPDELADAVLRRELSRRRAPCALLGIAVAEITCAVLYAVPPTAVLGAVLMTGYLGGAVATHVRVGESFLIPLGLGVLAWAGLYLRDRRLQALLPLRRHDGAHQRRP